MFNSIIFNGANITAGDLMEIIKEYGEYNLQICRSDGVIMQGNGEELFLEGYWFNHDRVDDLEEYFEYLNTARIYNDLTINEFLKRLQPYKNRVVKLCGDNEIIITINNNNLSIDTIG